MQPSFSKVLLLHIIETSPFDQCSKLSDVNEFQFIPLVLSSEQPREDAHKPATQPPSR